MNEDSNVPKTKAVRVSFSRMHELAKFGIVYFFIALIELHAKLRVTPAWLDGTLIDIHGRLLAFQWMNNEQSRLLQFYIPEAFRRLFGLSVLHAYTLQRWLFVFLALVVFHGYLRKWFDSRLAFAGVMSLAAIMPLSYFNDLQESSALLLVTFLLGLWAIREHRIVWYVIILTIGSINNETMLFLPSVYFFYEFKRFDPKHLVRLTLTTLATSLPAFLIVGAIRYLNRDRPHLGGAWHLPDNVAGFLRDLQNPPLDYWGSIYLYIFFIFGAFWVFAFLKYSTKPLFLRRAALMIPLFVVGHFLTGRIHEVRQMMPLSFLILPMAFFYLFPEHHDSATSQSSEERSYQGTAPNPNEDFNCLK